MTIGGGEKVMRSLLVYVFLIAALRVVGKRELGQANTLDLIVLLLVANAVQNGIIGNDLSVTGAVLGAATLFLVNEIFARTTAVWPFASRLLEGEPTMLIEEGNHGRQHRRRAVGKDGELSAAAGKRRQGGLRIGKRRRSRG